MKLGVEIGIAPVTEAELDIEVGVHLGNILMYISQIYSKPTSVSREYCANGIDAEARYILIESSHPHHRLRVFDNGKGAGYEEIKEKFRKVGKSLKSDDSSKIGEKGIGNLSGLAIGTTYELMTRDPFDRDVFRVFSLSKEDLRGDEIKLHCKEYPDSEIPVKLPFIASTMVQISNVNELAMRQLADIEEIERILVSSFFEVIDSGKVHITLAHIDKKGIRTERQVKAVRFRGAKLKKETVKTRYGEIVFDMYYSPKPLKDPLILIEHKKVTNVPLSNLWHRKQLSNELKSIYLSELFEGTIHVSFCTLSPARDSFEWDNALETFIAAVETYANETLCPYVDNYDEEAREERYQKISKAVSDRMTQFLKDNPSLIPESLRASSGRSKNLTPEEAVITILGTRDTKPKTKPATKPISPSTTPTTQVKNKPTKKSHAIKSNKGSYIPFEYHYPTEEEGFNWHSRVTSGSILVNIANTDWVAAETANKSVDYVSILVQKELTLALMSDTFSKEKFNEIFESTFMKFWRANL